ncbi:phosphatidylinositol N-acetylglucosaminyltransferase subunit C [Arthroderma uncinatum]|uniref:phosphatidylinositol N-acetylglucosaminyltransferase subunit C n=1 Tax=Arthroderma uncinatum TaxID=74035 RepID=UPI00144A642C|nr:phosphatidylinositol N-acetylglucosaminyltransferase subunit C [Arthroderma uncinatum]KAF3482269.1 phosphatidylinositol N-acetylglucosaminyltransferase subunit C [Arthroderma uncinatum]
MASNRPSPQSSPSLGPQSRSQPQNSPRTLAAPIPPPVPVETHPNRAGLKARPVRVLSPDPSRLAPEDAYFTSPPRLRPGNVSGGRRDGGNNTNDTARLLNRSVATPAAVAALRIPPAVPGLESKPARDRNRSRRKRKGQWKKLLWVKQSYPDNYTDTETFLDHLQRNPRLQPYDFWPLVADFTVIERVNPISVVSCGSICTILGWVVWDYWVAKDGMEAAEAMEAMQLLKSSERSSAATRNHSNSSCSNPESLDGKENGVNDGLGLSLDSSSIDSLPSREGSDSGSGTRSHSLSTSATSLHSEQSTHLSLSPESMNAADCPLNSKADVSSIKPSGVTTPVSPLPAHSPTAAFIASRHRQMFTTVKSALLIFCTLRGLSPILKSLTKSTTSDSIWAMSCWLMAINIFFFDYGSGEKNIPVGGAATANFPASLSTNAALMASTVLASRLKSTSHVFSLTLFSIEVFGLFPVFRRYLRSYSWRGHVALTVSLVIAASASVGITLRGGLAGAIIGILFGCPSTALIMGSCSWWLISLQRYKNVVIGPWDPAKPIIRRHWD